MFTIQSTHSTDTMNQDFNDQILIGFVPANIINLI